MLISVFTPTNNSRWLLDCYNSLVGQSFKNWEWILIVNHFKGEIPEAIKGDTRVKIYNFDRGTIGGLKSLAASECKGDILVELDHDDYLTLNCLSTLADHYSNNPEPQNGRFYFSEAFEFSDEKIIKPYSDKFGWESAFGVTNNRHYVINRNFDVTARSLCEIFYAPNHVRAWTKKAYKLAGGYNEELMLGDDHDLMCRTYLAGTEFVHLNMPLYWYRHHAENNSVIFNDQVLKQQTKNLNDYLHPLINEWCRRENLPKIDLGSAHNKPEDYIGIDLVKAPGVDLTCDVIKGLPFKNNSIGCVRAVDFIEHTPAGKLPVLFNEIYRVLAPGGWFISQTPSTDGRGAFQDPTHTSFINSNSLWYYTNRDFAKYVPAIKCRFQAVRVWNDTPNEFCKLHNIVYLHADLCALKGQRQPGLIHI